MPTLHDFLLKQTKSGELCVICENGWVSATCFIDHEDLFIHYIHPKLMDKPVKDHYFGSLGITDKDGNPTQVSVRFIEV